MKLFSKIAYTKYLQNTYTMSTSKQINKKKAKKVPADVKKLFATAKKLGINLSAIAREVGKSRFHIYAVRDGEYKDQNVIDILIKMVKKAQAKKIRQQKAIKKII